MLMHGGDLWRQILFFLQAPSSTTLMFDRFIRLPHRHLVVNIINLTPTTLTILTTPHKISTATIYMIKPITQQN